MVVVDLPFERDGAFALATVLRQLRMRDGVAARLVALTGHHEHKTSEAFAAGFDAQVTKPLDAHVLERTLLDLLGHSRATGTSG